MNLSGNVVYGSGVLLADGPNHLPSHTTGDLYFRKSFAERWQLGLTVLNVFLDRSDRCAQRRRKPSRCQRTTVSG